MIDGVDRSCERNCLNCVFQYKRDHGKVLYCTLKNFAILNPEIGCSRQMERGAKKNWKYLTAEERAAIVDAVKLDELNNGTGSEDKSCEWEI